MVTIIRYLTHPQVLIDPAKDVPRWSLNDVGRARVAALVKSNALQGTTCIISSAETKAIETAEPLAISLGCDMEVRAGMHENDRSATGFLPPQEFEEVADRFFANPHESIRGWETAIDAQKRIMREIDECLRVHSEGDILIVGHGGVGTLLYCALSDVPISRRYDQGPGGGGCHFAFARNKREPLSGWKPMESMSDCPRG